MYAMKVVASSVLRTMMFPHQRKVVTVDQLTHYEPLPNENPENVITTVSLEKNLNKSI